MSGKNATSHLIEAAIVDKIDFGVLEPLTRFVMGLVDEAMPIEKVLADLLLTTSTMASAINISRDEFARLAGVAFDKVNEVLPACRVCGCTDANCAGCILKTGAPCWWIEDDLCSACVPRGAR